MTLKALEEADQAQIEAAQGLTYMSQGNMVRMGADIAKINSPNNTQCIPFEPRACFHLKNGLAHIITDIHSISKNLDFIFKKRVNIYLYIYIYIYILSIH